MLKTRAAQDVVPTWVGKSLHDLCQPLTALECGLAIAMMTVKPGCRPNPEEMEEAIRAGLRQCERMIEQVRVMQLKLLESE